MTVISAADGEPAVETTPRQIAIGKMIAAAIGGVPVAILLLAFQSNTGSASNKAAPEVVADHPDRAAEDVARVKAQAQANAEGKAEGKPGTFFSSCTERPSGGVRVRQYRQLSYQYGAVRESTSTACGAVP